MADRNTIERLFKKCDKNNQLKHKYVMVKFV